MYYAAEFLRMYIGQRRSIYADAVDLYILRLREGGAGSGGEDDPGVRTIDGQVCGFNTKFSL
jgi:hypothetical protein